MKLRKELWFGLILMVLIVVPTVYYMPLTHMTQGHYGLLMLSLVVVAIMLGFPTAFTLMGMGVIFTFIAYRFSAPELAVRQTLDLMALRAYAVMTNDVLIAVPLFVFMGYLVERANLIERLFKGLHLAIGKIPGSLAVATLATCAVFATATGIIGAVVTLMGLLALPSMLKAGYNVKLSAGVITAGGTLGILIPPSVLLILYGATASVSVVQLYAGAFFPGIMLAGLYMVYVIVIAMIKPEWAPKPSEADTRVTLPPLALQLSGGARRRALPALLSALFAGRQEGVAPRAVWWQLGIALLPVFALVLGGGAVYRMVTTQEVVDTSGLQEMGSFDDAPAEDSAGVQLPPEAKQAETATAGRYALDRSKLRAEAQATAAAAPKAAEGERLPAPLAFWIVLGVMVVLLLILYALQTFERLEIFKMLLGSFFPLAVLILAVLGSIIMGWATPTEAAAMGAAGGLLLAAAYRRLTLGVVRESVFLTAKTTAMVCWLFVGSSIFSAAFALLGGQEIVETWVISLNLSSTQFLLLAQFIIFILGWPLEWTEIIVIFMPIFLPLLTHFQIDPLFFGLLVAVNLQTAFLSPPVAMAAFYLKGVAPPHVTLNQIFAGMMPFMGIQVLALFLLYLFPQIGLWLPSMIYK
jgi:TRAP-type mannitol/chloroaromatic compound transport system permease large subunit